MGHTDDRLYSKLFGLKSNLNGSVYTIGLNGVCQNKLRVTELNAALRLGLWPPCDYDYGMSLEKSTCLCELCKPVDLESLEERMFNFQFSQS